MARYDSPTTASLSDFPLPGGPLPPLPQPIPDPVPERLPPFEPGPVFPPFPRFRALRHGCYLARFTPRFAGFPFVHYDGTIRVQRGGLFNTTASGDLYLHRLFWWWPPGRGAGFAEPNPGNGIPVFPRSLYRYYLRVTQILEGLTFANSFTLGFERHAFNHATNSWTSDGTFTALMTWQSAPSGYPSSSDYLEGDVKDSSGTLVGRLTMGWVSKYLRRATVEIDRVAQSEYPGDNGAGFGWRDFGDHIDWDLTEVPSQSNLTEPSGESWSDAEAHQAMLAARDSADLDSEWRYHLLCVRRLDSTSRGIMYDAFAGDSNNVPREGAAIASHWVIPDTPMWGLVRGMRFGQATAPYFRTAAHELGHAFGIYHNTVDNGFMNTTGVIASNAAPGDFPNNVLWTFAADDLHRLRHMPDVWVRPGGIPFGQPYSSAPISAADAVAPADGLVFRATPLETSVPLGAPVRIDVELTNTTDQPLPAPRSLSLKSEAVRGVVIDPAGTIRTFRPLVLCIEEEAAEELAPGDKRTHSLTLLRGGQGALFPSPGNHRVVVQLRWEVGGHEVGLDAETTVMVTSPLDQDHADAARKILSTPDALLALAIGGDHLKEGVEAIQAGYENPVLRPHYAVIEAKRLGRRFGKRKADLSAAAEKIDEDTVLSGSEIQKLAEMVDKASASARKNDATRQMVRLLKKKVKDVDAGDDVSEQVKKLKA